MKIKAKDKKVVEGMEVKKTVAIPAAEEPSEEPKKKRGRPAKIKMTVKSPVDKKVEEIKKEEVVAEDTPTEEKGITEMVPTEAGVSKFTKQESMEVLERVREIRNRMDSDYFELAGLLWKVYDKKMYEDWGFTEFKSFVTEELGFGNRKAQYFLGIHDYFVNTLGDPEILAKVKPLGWAKTKELKDVVTAENVDEWVERAKSMNVATLAEAAKRALTASPKTDFSDGEGGEAKAEPEEVEVARTMSFKLYDEQYSNVQAALERATELTHSDKKGHLLDSICTDYMSTNAFTSGGRKAIPEFFAKFEDQLKIKIFAVDTEQGECLYGEGDGIRIVAVDLNKEEIICGDDVLNQLVVEEDK